MRRLIEMAAQRHPAQHVFLGLGYGHSGVHLGIAPPLPTRRGRMFSRAALILSPRSMSPRRPQVSEEGPRVEVFVIFLVTLLSNWPQAPSHARRAGEAHRPGRRAAGEPQLASPSWRGVAPHRSLRRVPSGPRAQRGPLSGRIAGGGPPADGPTDHRVPRVWVADDSIRCLGDR